MPHHPNSRQPSTADSSGQPKWGWGWGVKKLIDGALCRQCRGCRKWFHIGWLAYHNCKVPKPRSK